MEAIRRRPLNSEVTRTVNGAFLAILLGESRRIKNRTRKSERRGRGGEGGGGREEEEEEMEEASFPKHARGSGREYGISFDMRLLQGRL